MTITTNPDVTVEDHGSLIALTPHTEEAKEWIEKNVFTESWQWLGANLMIDHRFAPAIVEGMQEAGLVVA